MAKKRGFSVLMLDDGGDSVAEMRRGVRRDIRRAMEKIDNAQGAKDQRMSDILRAFSTVNAWEKWGEAQANISSRLGRMSLYVETSGSNIGRIVIPSSWNDRARNIVGELVNGYLGLSVDVYNGFSADRALTLWGFLANEMGLGGLGDSVIGALLFMQFTGNGLQATSVLPALPQFAALGTVIVPQLTGTTVAVLG